MNEHARWRRVLVVLGSALAFLGQACDPQEDVIVAENVRVEGSQRIALKDGVSTAARFQLLCLELPQDIRYVGKAGRLEKEGHAVSLRAVLHFGDGSTLPLDVLSGLQSSGARWACLSSFESLNSREPEAVEIVSDGDWVAPRVRWVSTDKL